MLPDKFHVHEIQHPPSRKRSELVNVGLFVTDTSRDSAFSHFIWPEQFDRAIALASGFDADRFGLAKFTLERDIPGRRPGEKVLCRELHPSYVVLGAPYIMFSYRPDEWRQRFLAPEIVPAPAMLHETNPESGRKYTLSQLKDNLRRHGILGCFKKDLDISSHTFPENSLRLDYWQELTKNKLLRFFHVVSLRSAERLNELIACLKLMKLKLSKEDFVFELYAVVDAGLRRDSSARIRERWNLLEQSNVNAYVCKVDSMDQLLLSLRDKLRCEEQII